MMTETNNCGRVLLLSTRFSPVFLLHSDSGRRSFICLDIKNCLATVQGVTPLNKNLLSTNLAGLKLANPTVLASGILGYTGDSMQRVAEAGAGAVVTKSVGIEPRPGYPNPTVVQAEAGLINAIGLPNPGIDDFAEEIAYAKTVLKVPLIVSVFGYTAEEYATAAEKAVKAGADAVELNVSCPHVKDTGHEIGQNPKTLAEVVEKVKASVKKPVIVKLSPNVTDIVEIAKTAVRAGADALTAVNTVKAMAIDVEAQMPVLSNVKGGLSGPAIKPIALTMRLRNLRSRLESADFRLWRHNKLARRGRISAGGRFSRSNRHRNRNERLERVPKY